MGFETLEPKPVAKKVLVLKAAFVYIGICYEVDFYIEVSLY